jgi:hypothetical protein
MFARVDNTSADSEGARSSKRSITSQRKEKSTATASVASLILLSPALSLSPTMTHGLNTTLLSVIVRNTPMIQTLGQQERAYEREQRDQRPHAGYDEWEIKQLGMNDVTMLRLETTMYKNKKVLVRIERE